jgi:hypothetical protein
LHKTGCIRSPHLRLAAPTQLWGIPVTLTSSLPHVLDEPLDVDKDALSDMSPEPSNIEGAGLLDIDRDEDRRQVFVDRTGQRGRRLRLAGYASGVAGLVYVSMVGISLAGGPVEPGTLLSLPSAPLEAVEKAIERIMPGPGAHHPRPAVGGATTGGSQLPAAGQTSLRQRVTGVSPGTQARTPSAKTSTPALKPGGSRVNRPRRAPSDGVGRPAPAKPAPAPANRAPQPAAQPPPVNPAPQPVPGNPAPAKPAPAPADPAPVPGPADPGPARGGAGVTLGNAPSLPDVAAETAKSATGVLGG